jgi:tRNA(Ile)-lysidine synthase
MESNSVNLIDLVNNFLEKVPPPYVLMFSGGQDSVSLSHILRILEVPFFIFHLNYGLRGKESDQDENFVRDWCLKYSIPFKILRAPKDFNSSANFQSRARDLRYEAVTNYCKEVQASSVLTAHHTNDSAETFLFHAARGTGLSGLISMSSKNDNVYRPFWSVSKDQINFFGIEHKLVWREDSTNQSDKYTRNHIRHNSLSSLIKAVPQALQGLKTTQRNLREINSYLKTSINRDKDLYLHKSYSIPGAKIIDRNIFDVAHGSLLFNYIIKPLADFDYQHVISLNKAQVGTHIQFNGWQIWHEREGLVLLNPDMVKKRSSIVKPKNISAAISNIKGNCWNGSFWNFEKQWKLEYIKSKETQDFGDLMNPILKVPENNKGLFWRTWIKGDYIYPLGMKGKKKISDILTDSKVPSCLRHQQVLLSDSISLGEVYWIPGLQLSRNVKIDNEEKYIRFNDQ